MTLLSAILRAGVKITASVRPAGSPLRATRAALTLTPAAVDRVKVSIQCSQDRVRYALHNINFGTGVGQHTHRGNAFQELLSSQPNAIGLKVGLKHRGCNGMSYVLDFAHEKAKFDEEVIQVNSP